MCHIGPTLWVRVRRAAGSNLAPHAALLVHLSGPTGSVVNLGGLTGLRKAVSKSRPSHL